MLSIIIIFFVGILAYSNAFLCSFHFDDLRLISGNLAIRNIHDLPAIWNFYPCRFLTFLSLAFNYHFHGLDLFGYHLFNILVHIGSAILVWWLTRLTLSTPVMRDDKIAKHGNLIALFAGLVFVSHPVQTEAVTYIWQRAASMATLFYLASLCLYVKSRLLQKSVIASEAKQSFKPYYICSLITAIAAMFTKETAVTLPLMILLYEFIFLKWEGATKRLAPFLLTIFIIPVTMLFTNAASFQKVEGIVNISSMHYLLTQFRVLVTYIRLFFLPVSQNFDYDYPVFKNIFQPSVLISLLFLMTVLFVAKRLFSKYRLLSFSILWFFLTLLPESSILPQDDVIYEHRLYLPMVGYSIFLVSSVYYLWEKNSIASMVKVFVVLIACYSVLTYQRNKVWKDEFTLWSDSVRKSPHKARPYNNLGVIYSQQGNMAQALADYNKAIEIYPGYANAYNNRANVYFQQGDITQAIADYNKAIELDPSYADAYHNRALAYYQLRRHPP